MRILEGKKLTKFFGGLAAVSEVDFDVDHGEIVGLIGPNGAGKTTLFNLISGAIIPDSGALEFKGQKLTGLKAHLVCRAGVARTFQSVRVFPNMTALGNVSLGGVFGKGMSSAAAAAAAEELLDFVGLAGAASTRAGDLTLAHQKRLEVARALATRPEVMLLDEVIAGLNLTEAGEVMDLITRIRDRGITILMIEHVMKAIMSICNRIIVLHHGEKIAEGSPAEITSNETVIKIYLGK
ncbi:MAG TPA: ABC transporter ATP-binding protein [Syntrophorhabdales bacterium]|nr:ABC transporter ATP-binding protein [Syntrophorhabdales bacterium]